jgi:hypothetical protein
VGKAVPRGGLVVLDAVVEAAEEAVEQVSEGGGVTVTRWDDYPPSILIAQDSVPCLSELSTVMVISSDLSP